MAVLFCTRHRIGFNTDLDPVCPQCTLSRMEPADEVADLKELPARAANARKSSEQG